MSFDFNPDSQQAKPEPAPSRERIGFLSKVVLALFLALACVWAAWGPVSKSARLAWARHCAREARAALEEKDWSRAVEQTLAAKKAAPEDPEVIRTVVEFLKVSGSDPAGLVLQLRLLEEQQPLTEDEQILLGNTLASQGKTAEARKVYQSLPLFASTQDTGLTLLSNILRQEGHADEASEVSRRATFKQPDSPQARVKQALDDMKSSFIEIRRRAHAELMAVARMKSEIAMEAATHLTVDPLLTAAEAQELLSNLEDHAHKNLPVRLGIVSALARLQPGQRRALIDAEITRFQSDGNEGTLEQLARWLALEKQHDRLLKLVPPALAARSRELYPVMAQALAEEGRWKELKELLTSSKPPVSPPRVAIWLAEASSHLERDLNEASLLLSGAVESSTKDGNLSNLLAAAMTAEKLNLGDIAVSAYIAASEKAPANASGEGVKWLQKAADIALIAKNTTALLNVFRKLHELRPSSTVFSERLTYLRLILGVEMETVDFHQLAASEGLHAALTVTVERVPPELLRALAAYRLGDDAAMKEHLAGFRDITGLTPGQRAVAAGLLSLVGKQERAFQIAEKVPGALLLEEERSFLKKAL